MGASAAQHGEKPTVVLAGRYAPGRPQLVRAMNLLGVAASLLLCASACSPLIGLDKNYSLGAGGSGATGATGSGGDASAAGGSAGSAGLAGAGGRDASPPDGAAGANSGTGGLRVVQDAPAATSGTQASCILPTVQKGDALVVAVKSCVAPGNIGVSDSSGAGYVAAWQASTGLAYFGSFEHAAGAITVTVTGNYPGCFILLDCMEVAGGVHSFVASNSLIYGSIGVSRTGTTSSPDASATHPELLIGSGEVEGPTNLGALSDYGSGGGTPTGLPAPAETPDGKGAQMWSAFQVIRDSKQYGLQRTLDASANGVGGIVILSTAP